MAELTRQRAGELLRGLFQILLPHQEGLAGRQALEELESLVPPTPFEASEYPNRLGVRRFEKIVRFVSINAVKAGWLVKDKGQWSLTNEGRQAFEQFQDPYEFIQRAVELYRKWKKEQPLEEEVDESPEEAPGAGTTLEEAEEAAWGEIQEYIQQMPPYDFQRLVAALLRAMGYHISWLSPPGPDRGIDIIAHTDPLGASSPRIKVQVKRRADKVHADGMRSFMALLGDQDVGIFISTGGFTPDAATEARMQERRRLTLVGLERLMDLWTEHYERIPETERQLLPLTAVYFLSSRE